MRNLASDNSKIVKQAALLFIVSVLIFIFYLAQTILIPIIISLIVALLLLPLVHFFKGKLHFNDFLAVTTSLVLAVSCVFFLILIMSKQIASLFNDFPEIQKNLAANFEQVQFWIRDTFHFSFSKQNALLSKTVNSGKIINASSFQSLSSITDLLFNVVLIPIYTFLILIYRRNFINFIHALNNKKNIMKTNEILADISLVIRQYMFGLCIEMLIVALMTGFGLWIIGLKYFFFLAIVTALLNLIPYIGIIIACGLSILLTLVGSTDLTLISGVILVNIIVQVIDNNILIPKIVGSKVSINALASMIAVILGGALAGIGGMFLALPILAILKVIFDHFTSLKAYSILIGEK